MKFNLRKVMIACVGATVAFTLPTAAFAASDMGWIKSTKLYEIRTLAGKSELGHRNGSLSETTFFHPRSAIALLDGRLLVSDSTNHLIRVLTSSTSANYGGLDLGKDGANLPLGGYNDDVLEKAAFDQPSGLAIDGQGNVLIADSNNNAIRRIAKDGTVTTLAGNGVLGLADGVGSKATFYQPSDVAVDRKGNVYVADTLNNVIRKITSEGKVSTLTALSTRKVEYFPGAVEASGDFLDGPIASAKFNEPSGLAVDTKGNLYVSDRGNQRIRYINFTTGTVLTIAGGGTYDSQSAYIEGDYVDGATAQSRLNAPEGLTITADGTLIVADSLNHAIRMIKDGKVSTLAGIPTEFGKIDGVIEAAQFNHPTDVTVLADGRLVIIDEFGNKVRILQKYSKPSLLPTNKGISILYQGSLIPSDVPVQLKSNAVLLPVRNVGDALGYKVGFDNTTGNSTLTKGDTVYTIANGTKKVTKTVNGNEETLTLNTPTIVVNNRVFIPVRFFAEERNLDIQWDSTAKIVVIRDKTF